MPETLLTISGIKLYGRIVEDLKVVTIPAPGAAGAPGAPAPPNHRPAMGANEFWRGQLQAASQPNFARIYAFSYEGHYYDLPKPALFLVDGPGISPFIPSNIDGSGVAAKDWELSQVQGVANPPRVGNAPAAPAPPSNDLRMWEYDKGDFSIRLDVETGPFEQILLEAALRGGSTLSSGADLRSSGADLRSSGADLRISGADLRNKR
jgi:hypothetical protein